MEKIIEFKNVSKEYRLGVIGSDTLQHDLQSFIAKLRGKENPNSVIGKKEGKSGDTFLALDKINLKINKGETVGIIGSNGAGKSTLLKLLSRVTAPSEGEIHLKGRVASMLEVGTGFHPELTGRENIYLNGSILGMTTAEVDKKIDSIIQFSECEQFIDTPVKRYSSGMYVKLAFAVAAHLDSEILLMDEVLAVGDMAFQQKCIEKMQSAVEQDNKTVLYVSHNMNTVRRLCDRCIVLEKGKIIFDGDVEKAIHIYMENANINMNTNHTFTDYKRIKNLGSLARLEEINFSGKESLIYGQNESVKFTVKYLCPNEVSGLKFRMTLSGLDGNPIGSAITDVLPCDMGEHEGEYTAKFSGVVGGRYIIGLHLFTNREDGTSYIVDTIPNACVIQIENEKGTPLWSKKTSGCVIFPTIK